MTEKGEVTVAVNGIGIEDDQHDISMPGSFVETLKNDITRMRWFLNHDVRQLLGVPLRGEERDGNVYMTGRLNLEKQIGRDTLADYKLYNEAGRTLEHSIGVLALERDKEDKRKVLKWKMLEYSTLTGWGSNPDTYLVGLKSEGKAREAVDYLNIALKQRYSDERLSKYENDLSLILKAIEGELIVKCPYCGHTFDYLNEPEHTFAREVEDAFYQYTDWVARGIVRDEVANLKPEIRAGVLDVIDTLRGETKGIAEAMSYVRCPNCYGRVHKSDTLIKDETPEEKASFWDVIAKSIGNK